MHDSTPTLSTPRFLGVVHRGGTFISCIIETLKEASAEVSAFMNDTERSMQLKCDLKLH